MRVLFVDNKLTGHHVSYMKKLSESQEITAFYFLPEEIIGLTGPQKIMKSDPNSLKGYLKWIREVAEVAAEYKVDLVHFLYADALYKGFGIGLHNLKKYTVVATFHQVRRSFLRDLSRKMIFKQISCGVVHTDKLQSLHLQDGIRNVTKIEYPKFNALIEISKMRAREYFSIPQDINMFLALGGTRFDKGLDLMLEAFSNIKLPFHLLIAGKEETFTKTFIEEKISAYRDKVSVVLKFLSEEEMNLALSACDVVVLPYRKIFDGASGPLADGVWNRKIILGSNHGSLGDIIESNQLGLTFISEDTEDLRNKIISILQDKINWNDKSENYRMSLDPDNFLKSYEEVYFSK
ncbi:glycosyltransferase family 4 protein [Paenibacillus sp. BK720]|uniref:glycosyltransferase family 4 protein n=1 Tax=Paenibacillus sp. BK720 TaxID=2587092 RepID=UPI0014242CDC|nr:glycosyltransferase family 4 protein [Paenibacillus sp. BK720]NIK69237.1 glycosyltransferase involved in cell wall biosynthesis [Paenibacillus sp. BK720]